MSSDCQEFVRVQFCKRVIVKTPGDLVKLRFFYCPLHKSIKISAPYTTRPLRRTDGVLTFGDSDHHNDEIGSREEFGGVADGVVHLVRPLDLLQHEDDQLDRPELTKLVDDVER